MNEESNTLSLVLIKLFKGVLYLEEEPSLWQHLLKLQTKVRDYVRIIGLDLVFLEDEGVAWLKPKLVEDGEEPLPSLVPKRQLSYPVSLLLALFRRKLVEHDASSGDSRLILNKEDVVEQLRLFLPSGSNEARIMDQIDTYINKIVELGFVRRLHNDSSKIEVKRIIKAFVDAQWLHDFEQKLQAYALHAGAAQGN
ncbi:hypothetical protein Lqui_1100 [Legionella quinlivanii]|uniref:DUF4194 domain-containing protein n=1 Tax=Legionella quinlivanii TaxID=45073 RepID=A0A0W0Y671_9GAMM|nr:DUF4194 domain-containing protein [Legionella quinlivanii]KTD52256.1 hypothetical protein Lqui_1100 [Legionella quinlivanii]SEF74327.1 protein of unknown function [Legionella quinlivanii DSM 21216]STY12245.1 Uncharacterised protein [Legionella quinlivanii]